MHWTRRVGLLCLCLLPIGWATVGSAQDAITTPTDGVVFLDDFSGSMALTEDGGTYLLFHKMIGDGVGFTHGYSRLGLRAKLWEDYDRHFFAEVHAMVTDTSKAGANVGGGYRWMYDMGVVGLHGWYDNFESSAGHRYQQVTVGAEYLHPGFDIRANGYIPFDDRDNFIAVLDPGTTTAFMGSTLGTRGIGLYERTLSGFDLEIGAPVPVIDWLRMYAGTYWLDTHKGGDTWGARGRAEARLSQGISLNVMVSDDNKFGTNVNLGVEVRWGGTGLPTRFIRDYATLDRRYDQVRRNWPVQLERVRDEVFVPLINVDTGNPFNIVWVNNTNAAPGRGTFEDPFNMLPTRAEGADLILVQRGVGNTVGNIRLEPDQQLLGEGKTHYVETDRLGVIPLPPEFRRTGAFPTLVSGAGAEPIIRLSDNNVVRAFRLEGVNGIAGPLSGANINNFVLECLRGDILNGINIPDASGLGVIHDVDFTVQPGGTGIRVANTSGEDLSLMITDVRTNGGATGMALTAAGGNVVFDIDNFRGSSASVAALALTADGSDLSGIASNVQANNNTGSGVLVNALAGTGSLTFENLQANDNGIDGMRIVANTGSVLDVSILDSTLSGNGDDNLQVDVLGGSTVTLFVDPTAMNNAGQHAFEFQANNGSTLVAIFEDVTMTGSTADAVNGRVLNGSTAVLDFLDVNGTGSGSNGLDATVDGGSTLLALFENVNFSDSGASGLLFTVSNNSQAGLIADNLRANNTGGNGLQVDVTTGAAGPSLFFGELANSRFNDNAANGIQVNVSGASSFASVDLQNIRLRRNGDDGLQFSATSGGTFVGTAFGTDNNLSNNSSSAIQGLVDGPNSAAFLDVDGAVANNSGAAGALFTVDNGGFLDVNLADVSINLSRQTGIDFFVNGGGSMLLTATGGTVSENGQSGNFSGVRGQVAGANTSASVSVDGTTVDSNTLNGFEFDVTAGATFVGELISSGDNGVLSASNNANNAVRFTASGANTTAALLMDGLNELNDSGAEGVFASANGVALFAIGAAGNINDSGSHGVRIDMNNVAVGAIQIQGDFGLSINNSGGDGVNITLANSLLDEVTVNTATRTATVGGLVIDAYEIDGNAGAGVRIVADNTLIVPDTFRITNVFANNNQGGSGIDISLTDSAADGLAITNSGFEMNAGNGIVLNLTRTPIDRLTIEDNDVGQGLDLGVTFFIDGDTFDQPFSVINNSGQGIDITRFRFDLAGTGVIWDTVEPGGSTPFLPLFGSDVDTGLVSVNGTAITLGSNPLEDASGNILPGGGVADGSTLINLTFNDFNPSEAFFWQIDADFAGDPASTVLGSDLIGANVVVDFTGGYQLSGQLMAVDSDPNAAIFVASQGPGAVGQGVVMNAGHGILINLDDSDLTNLSIQRNVVEANGLSGITINAVNGSDVSGMIASNRVRQNSVNGIALNFTDSSVTDLNIDGNIVDGNVGHGIALDFNNSPVTNLSISDNPLINNNTINGIDMQMVNSHINGLLIDNNGMGTFGPGPGPGGDYNIELVFLDGFVFFPELGMGFNFDPLTPQQMLAFADAAARWESIIIGDVPDVGAVDDLLILAGVTDLSVFGPNILGGNIVLNQRPGPAGTPGAFMPWRSLNMFNSLFTPADPDLGFRDTILHEMGHGIGFGSMWDDLNLVSGSGTFDPRFVGPLATAEHVAIFGGVDPNAASGVPLENFLAGPGTAEVHWDEALYGNELMTGFASTPNPNPISRVTVAQFADLGYEVNMTQADLFPLLGPSASSQVDYNELDIPGHVVGDASMNQASHIPAMVTGVRAIQAFQFLRQNGLHGINIELDGSDLSNAVISNNLITGHANGDGIRLTHAPGQAGRTVGVVFDGNMVSNNAGRGILVDLNGVTQLNLDLINNSITNHGQEGIEINVANAAAVLPGTNAVRIDNNVITNSGSDGAAVRLQNMGLASFNASGNEVTLSGGNGMVLDAANSPMTSVQFGFNTITDSAGGDGLLMRLTDSSVESLAITNSGIRDNLGHGINLDLSGSPVMNLEITGNGAGADLPAGTLNFDFSNLIWTTFMTNNSTPGFDIASVTIDLTPTNQVWRPDATPFVTVGFQPQNQTDVLVGLDQVNGVAVTPGTDPLEDINGVILPNGGVPINSQILTLDFVDFNPGEQLEYNLAHSQLGGAIESGTELTGAIGTVTLVDGRSASGVYSGFGMNVNQAFPQTFGGISTNGGNGILINAAAGSNIGALTIDANRIAANGVHGIEFRITDSTLPAVGDTSIVSNNTINDHASGDAIRIVDPDTNGTPFQLDFVDNTITDNANGHGINIQLNGNSGQMVSSIAGNTVSNSGGMGLRLAMTGTSQAELNLGPAGNTFDANTNAGIGISLANNAQLTFSAENTLISNTTTDGSSAAFTGQGLALRLTDSAIVNGFAFTDGGSTDNASQGIDIRVDLNSTLNDALIQNSAVDRNTADNLRFVRNSDANVNNVTITGSSFTFSETGDGINIVSGISDKTDEFLISDNVIEFNTGRGISLFARFDGDILATISGNSISGNGGTGVLLTEQVNNPAIDTRSITVDFVGNDISSNGGWGVDVQARHALTFDMNTIDDNTLGGINLAVAALNPMNPTVIANGSISGNGFAGLGNSGILIGNVNNEVHILNNTIEGNGNTFFANGDGITNTVGATTQIIGNMILDNANNGITLVNGSHIINDNVISGNGFSTVAFNDTGDGIEATSNQNGTLTIRADNNQILSNRARGLNVLVVGDTLADIEFTNGQIQDNMKEGAYFYVTTSLNRSVNEDANSTLFEGFGDIHTNPIMVLNFHNNNVIANGVDSGFDGTGLVVRVGTSGALDDPMAYEDDGGFVSDGMGFTAANLTGRGGVLASITNNVIAGNPGQDVLFESFDSTVEPFVTVGNWDAVNYDFSAIIPYEQDPIARFDLNFVGNTGDNANVVRPGYAHGFFPEPVFKSRDMAQATPGPFTSGTRLRNAQRLAFRGVNAFGDFTDPAMNTVGAGGDSDNFLYPGVGESSFRVTAASSTAGFLFGDDFTDTINLGVLFGELPFGWGTF